jgi:hypothetical protein
MPELVTEGAIAGGLSGRVAIHAANHAGGDFFGQDVTLIDGPVARCALFARFEVARVTEENKVWHLVNSHPFYFFSPPVRLCQLLDFATVDHRRVMANQALLGVRKPSLILFACARMALRTGQADRRMPLMAEGDGLRRDGEGKLLFFSFIDNRFLRQRDSARQTMQERGAKNHFDEQL